MTAGLRVLASAATKNRRTSILGPVGGVGLPAGHGIEDRLARVLGSPNRGIAGRGLLPAHDHGLVRLDEGMGHSVRAGLAARRLAEEVVFLDGGEAGVRVSRTDQAELIRIDP